jgi:ribonuclease R
VVKRYKKIDPFQSRESEHYENPVPSREFILQYFEEHQKIFSLSALIKAFGLKYEGEKEGITRRLRAMERDGQLMTNRRGQYALVEEMELIPGRIDAHKDGFGFLIPDDDTKADIFLPARQMREVFNNDRVLVRVGANQYRGRPEGVVVEVLERNTHQVVGRYIEEGGISLVAPDSKSITQDILITPTDNGGARHGQFVVVEITTQPTKRRQAMGRIVEVLGETITPGLEVELALRSHELPFEWPESVLEELDALPTELRKQDYEDREDLRQLPFVTIDGEDARDFDDAIFCQPKNKGWRLCVAIADVSHYVKPGTELDTEALTRGNSVYFPSRVIPMLPEKLSNGLCSLLPNVDRLVMVCDMHINQRGDMETYRFYPAVIHSHARLTYHTVAKALERGSIEPDFLYPHLLHFKQLFDVLLKCRHKRGAIEFETTETQIKFDANGKIDCIVPRERNVAHRMIEEAMLCANVCAADYLEQNEIPAVYRNHETPDEIKLQSLRDFLKVFSLTLSGGSEPTSMDYAQLIQQIKDRPDMHLLQTVLLRSMRQANYSEENKGHFGLAYAHYTHFTSPIRRYTDLIIHRAIKHGLSGKKLSKFLYDEEMMADIGEHCSLTERRADLATRDAMDWLRCEFMQDKVGHEYWGRITDVTAFGVFVELSDIYVQGLVHITALDNDYYHYDNTHHLLRGKRTGKEFRLGDQIKVLVARVDLDERQVDFERIA